MQMSHHGIAGSSNQLCFSISFLLGARGVLVAMLPEGSQVQNVLRQLLERALPGAARPSRSQHLLDVVLQQRVPQVHLRSTGAANLQRSQDASWFDPAFQLVAVFELCRPIFQQLLRPTSRHLVS